MNEEQLRIASYIEERLNSLGLLEGLFEVERITGLTVGKNLRINPCYEQIEPFQVVSKIEYKNESYQVYSKVYALQELFYAVSPDYVGQVYDLWEDLVNESKTVREEFQVGREFISYLNQEMLHDCYDIWKQNYSRLFAPLPRELPDLPFFPQHFKIFWKILQSSFPRYFDLSKDIIMGVWLRSLLKGLDSASWKWGINMLIERMFRGCRTREFDLDFKFSEISLRSLHPETQTHIGMSRLGTTCIGTNAVHSCGNLEVHLTTCSLQIYLAFYPNGDARNFISEITDMWLNANLNNVASSYFKIEWKFHYTGVQVPGALYEEKRMHEGLFRLGHSLWLTT